MSYTIIPLLEPEISTLFTEHPCCDASHAQDVPSRSSCTYPKTLLLHKADSTYSIVHARLGIPSGYTIRPPNNASLEITKRLQTHGDPLVSSRARDEARMSFRGNSSEEMERCREINEEEREKAQREKERKDQIKQEMEKEGSEEEEKLGWELVQKQGESRATRKDSEIAAFAGHPVREQGGYADDGEDWIEIEKFETLKEFCGELFESATRWF